MLTPSSPILLIGAGGIGNEVLLSLLHSLPSSPTKNITVVDLDTIEFSNLNRQFFFPPSSLSSPKSSTLTTSASSFFPSSSLKSHFSSIQSLPLKMLKKYKIIISCLDNLEARKYLNIICFIFKIKLIESGSSGLLGQIYSIDTKNHTPCFSCYSLNDNDSNEVGGENKEKAVCSVRSVPKDRTDCVAWGKLIYSKIFLNKSPSSDNNNNNNSNEDEEENKKKVKRENKEEENIEFKILKEENFNKKENLNLLLKFIKKFEPIYKHLIETAVNFNDNFSNNFSEEEINYLNVLKKLDLEFFSDFENLNFNFNFNSSNINLNSNSNLNNSEIKNNKNLNKIKEIENDKEEESEFSLKLITRLANLKCEFFDMKKFSEFEVRGIVENIQEAFLGTNAIIGLLVPKIISAFNESGKGQGVCYWINKMGEDLIYKTKLGKKDKDCNVCSRKIIKLEKNELENKINEILEIYGLGSDELETVFETRDKKVFSSEDIGEMEFKKVFKGGLEGGEFIFANREDGVKYLFLIE